MHEQSTGTAPEPLEPQPPESVESGDPVTENPEVDEVIRAVQELEERPVEEYVGVFEHAHEQLRRALDAP